MKRWHARIFILSIAAASAGCVSSPGAAGDDLEGLLERMRHPAAEARTHVFENGWQATGGGRMLSARMSSRMLADDEGRFDVRLDGPFSYAEVHDGHTTWKLLPWGTVVEAEAEPEEISLIPMWVVTGYWLSPDAPVVITASGKRRKGDVVTLEVRHRDGKVPFEVLVDSRRAVPIVVKSAGAVPLVELELADHRIVNARPVPGIVRSIKNGNAIVEMQFGVPRPIGDDGKAWSRPAAVAKSTYDVDASPTLEAIDAGNGFLFVKPAINGRQLGWFLFDTGAPSTLVGLAVAKQLGLRSLGEAASTGVGGHAKIGIHTVESIRIGPVEVGPTVVASMDVLRLGWKNLPIEGIIGCDVIGRAVVEYDIRSGSIEFHDPATYALPAGASWQHVVLNEGKPIARVPFEGHEGNFLVDTGAGGTFSISKSIVDRLDLLDDRQTSASGVRGVGGNVTMRRGTVRWLEFGGTRYEDVATRFAVADFGSYAQIYPDGIVGINLIDDYLVVFDLGNSRMAFLDRR